MRLTGVRFFVMTALMCIGGRGLTAQPPVNQQAFTCVANAGTPVIVRVEGITELVGDLLLNCTGGAPTPLGLPVPTANIKLLLNANISSRTLSGSYTDALLLIDEPKPNIQSATAPPVSTPVLGTGNGVGTYSGGILRPNVYQARQAGLNAVEWDGVPIDPPGTTGERIIRVTNVRANANQLGLSSTLIPTQIVGFIQITGAPFITINNPQQTLAFVQQGLSVAARSPDGKNTTQANLAECSSSHNVGSFASPPSPLSPDGQIWFTEGSNGTFQPRSAAQPYVPGTIYNSETSFYNPALVQNGTRGDLTQGLADFGTRLKATFNNIPNGARLFVSVTSIAPGAAQLIDTGQGENKAIADPGNGAVQLPVTNGSASAVWEVLKSNPSAQESVAFNYFTAWNNCLGTTATCPTGTTMQVTGSLVPSAFGTSFAAAPSPGPATNTALSGVSVNRCFPGRIPSLVTVAPIGPINFNYISGASLPGSVYTTTFGLVLDNGPQGAFDSGIKTTSEVDFLPGPNSNEPEATANSWLTATTTSDTTPITVTLQADPKGLATGTYNARVRFTASGVTVSPLDVPVTLTVQPSRPILKLAGVQHAATYVSGSVTPGEVAVFFGELFGPATIAVASANGDTFPSSVGNTQVLFDGNPAPMIYAAKNQVSAMVPFGLATKTSTQVQIVYNGVKSDAITVPVVSALPGLFSIDSSGGGQGAIFNQDGGLNSIANPAPAGTIVVLFGTGAGQTTPAGEDGKLALTTFPTPLQPVTVFFEGAQGNVLYGAQAPTLIQGVLQINVRIPATVKPSPGVPIVVKVGTQQSPAWATVAVGPAQ